MITARPANQPPCKLSVVLRVRDARLLSHACAIESGYLHEGLAREGREGIQVDPRGRVGTGVGWWNECALPMCMVEVSKVGGLTCCGDASVVKEHGWRVRDFGECVEGEGEEGVHVSTYVCAV